jgi:hypothetical protein
MATDRSGGRICTALFVRHAPGEPLAQRLMSAPGTFRPLSAGSRLGGPATMQDFVIFFIATCGYGSRGLLTVEFSAPHPRSEFMTAGFVAYHSPRATRAAPLGI